MFLDPKPKKTYKPKPYEQMTHPGERVQVDVKVVPRSCIADPDLRLFQYTAIDEFTRLRFLAAYPEQSTYSSADFLRKLTAWYRRTGIQFQPFNTIYQLYADKLAGRLEGVTDFLMIPEYLMYKLCGAKSHEYTNATTGGIVSAETGEFDPDIIAALNLPAHLFRPLQQPGTVIGEYKGIRVVLCATHDTGSAAEGIPMDGNELYISSGTWSLLGVKTPKPVTDEASRAANYSNEGGVGYNRYQKNLMGMWLANRLRVELCPDKPWNEITAEAKEKHFDHLVDVNDPIFLAPESMKAAFDAKLPHPPKCAMGYFRCAYRSLAQGYKQAIDEIERNTGKTYHKLYIVGGGAKNAFLNRLTAEATGKEVIALPIEATALGNLKVQMKAAKEE